MNNHEHQCVECDATSECVCEEGPEPNELCYRCEMAARKATQYAGWHGTPEGEERAARYAAS